MLFKAILGICEERNFIVHGKWYIKPANDHNIKSDLDFNVATLLQYKKTSDKVESRVRKVRIEDYPKLLARLKKMKLIFYSIEMSTSRGYDEFDTITYEDLEFCRKKSIGYEAFDIL